jgi:hypothetical protein
MSGNGVIVQDSRRLCPRDALQELGLLNVRKAEDADELSTRK